MGKLEIGTKVPVLYRKVWIMDTVIMVFVKQASYLKAVLYETKKSLLPFQFLVNIESFV